jgi:predicted DNA-binding transcriptional regulator AlpA
MPPRKNTPTPLDEVMREAEVSARTRVAPGTLGYWRATHRGPRWFRLGGRRIGYLRSDVERWLFEQYESTG